MTKEHPLHFGSTKRYLLFALASILVLSAGIISFLPKADATTSTITSSQNLGSRGVNAGDTLIINPGVVATYDTLTNAGNLIVMGSLLSNSPGSVFQNTGAVHFLAGSTSGPAVAGQEPGKLTNFGPAVGFGAGYVSVDKGATFGLYVFNRGTFNNYGDLNLNTGNPAIDNTGSSAFFGNYGNLHLYAASFKNTGGTITNGATGSWYMEVQPMSHVNDGGIIQNFGSFSVAKSHLLENKNGGQIYNQGTGVFTVGFVESGAGLVNRAGSTITNVGRFVAEHSGGITNEGTFSNAAGAKLETWPQVESADIGVFSNAGTFKNNAGATIDNQGKFVRECNDVFNNAGTITGNSIINNCVSFPLVHMQDTTTTTGSLTYIGRQINAEYVNSTSQLIGDKIDSITLRLQRIGSPPGTFQVGIFNADLTPKKSFEIRSTSTLPTSFQDYEFKLSNGELYTIQIGDRIGIKYNGGDTSNGISVMTDRDFADPFDGNKSYRARYETSWIVSYGEDMYMILKQTHAEGPPYPITWMSDTTASSGSLVYSGRPFNAEWVKSSDLAGKKIDSITVRLQRIGAPTGTFTVGVYDSALHLKKAFGIVSVSAVPTAYTDMEFMLSNNELYTVQQDDRIGVFYNGGSSTVGINVMIDRNSADPYDGTNSQRVRYEAGGWLYFDTAEDLYMVLKQTHG